MRGSLTNPAAGPSGGPTLRDVHTRQDHIMRQLSKIKGTLVTLREELAAARKANYEQNDRLHKIDLVIANIVDNFPDPSMI